MSSILEALKKADREDQEKKEKKVDRVVWKMPERQKKGLEILRRIAFLSGSALFIVLCVTWGIHTLQKEQTEVAAPVVAPNDENLTLSGILWDAAQPLAIINSALVKKGDTVQGAVVTEISENKVELSREGDPLILSLEKE